MGKGLVRAGIILLLLALPIIGPGHAEAVAENLLQNGGFELVDSQGKGIAWKKDFWQPTSRLGLTKSKSRGGSNAAFLYADKENDIRLVQTVQVKPDTLYRFSGWVAVRGVPEKGLGANLCVMGGFVHSKGVTGTTAWQYLELVFKTGRQQSQVTVGARLGYFGDTTRGTAFFDDLELVEVTDPSMPYQLLGPAEEKPYAHGSEAPELTEDRPWEEGFGIKAGRLLGKITGYPTWIILFYLLLFLLLFLRRGEKEALFGPNQEPFKNRLMWLFFLAAGVNVLVRIPLFKDAPFPTDMSCFKAWALRMATVGPRGFYTEGYFCDYPPFSMYLFWLVGWILKAFNWSGNDFLANTVIKLPALACDLATAWLILQLLRRKNPRLGLLLAVIYMYLPAILYNSSYWGQVDTYYAFLMMAAFYLIVKGKPELAAACVAASFLTKAQTAAFIPVLVFFMFLRYPPRRIAGIVGAAALATLVMLLPFNWGKPLTWIFRHYANMAGQYKYASFNAANFLLLLGGNNRSDSAALGVGLTYRTLGFLLFFLSSAWCCYYLYHRRTKAGLAAVFATASWAFFLFFPRMHERYLFPTLGFLLLAFGYLRDRRIYFLGVLLSLSYFFNLHAVILRFGNALQEPVFSRGMYILAMVNTGLFVAFVFVLQSQLPGWGRWLKSLFRRYDAKLAEHLREDLKSKPFRLNRREYLLVGVFLALYGVFVFFRLGSWKTPQKGMELRAPVEIVLSSPADIGTLVIYDAEGEGELSIEKYSGGAWSPAASVSCQYFYVLRRMPFSAEKVERLRLVPQPSAGHINEIAFLGPSGKPVPMESVVEEGGRRVPADKSPLFDEQEKMTAKTSYLNSTYFDEIYHGRTAYEFLRGSGVYETTHPPFGKDLLALGIAIFGMNPFGMRFVPALTGIFLMLVLFLLGRQVLGSRFGAYSVMALGMLDFMPFVQSRYSTIDTISVLFLGLMFLFVFRFVREQETAPEKEKSFKSLALAIFCFALAASTKWTTVYGFAGAAAIFFLVKLRQYRGVKQAAALVLQRTPKAKKGERLGKGKKKNDKYLAGRGRASVFTRKNLLPSVVGALLIFLLIAPLVYYLTYIPFLKCAGVTGAFSGQAVRTVVKNQKDMYDYHAKLKATHPFTSSWWSWPFDFKPLWIYPDKAIEVKPGNKASIVSMGNPLIWWLGVVAVLAMLYQLLIIRRFSVMHLVFLGFLSQYLPWILVRRISFIYHFYPVLPFYYLILAGFLAPLWNLGRRGRRTVQTFFLACLLALVLFYPVLAGVEVPCSYVDRFLRWFPGDWVF